MAARKWWSQLAASTKARLRKTGATPARYNAWNRMKPGTRKGLDRNAYLGGKGVKEQRTDAKRDAAFKNIMDKLPGANPRQVRRGVDVMTGRDLNFAIKATADKLRKKARQPAYDTDDLAYEGMDVPDINPFWYN